MKIEVFELFAQETTLFRLVFLKQLYGQGKLSGVNCGGRFTIQVKIVISDATPFIFAVGHFGKCWGAKFKILDFRLDGRQTTHFRFVFLKQLSEAVKLVGLNWGGLATIQAKIWFFDVASSVSHFVILENVGMQNSKSSIFAQMVDRPPISVLFF